MCAAIVFHTTQTTDHQTPALFLLSGHPGAKIIRVVTISAPQRCTHGVAHRNDDTLYAIVCYIYLCARASAAALAVGAFLARILYLYEIPAYFIRVVIIRAVSGPPALAVRSGARLEKRAVAYYRMV